MHKVYNEALKMSTKERDEHLKKYGLQNVKVWRVSWGVFFLLNPTLFRVYSGISTIQTHIMHFHLIIYTQTTLACSKTTYGSQ